MGNEPNAISLKALIELSSSTKDRDTPGYLAPLTISGNGILRDKTDWDNEPINIYNISSTFKRPTNAITLVKAANTYN